MGSYSLNMDISQESFCNPEASALECKTFLPKYTLFCFLINIFLQNKVYFTEKFGNFLDNLKNIMDALESFRHSGKFHDTLESFQILENVSGCSEKFPDTLKIIRTLWKVSEYSGKFLYALENFLTHFYEALR